MVIPLIRSRSTERDQNHMARSHVAIMVITDKMRASTMIMWLFDAAMTIMPTPANSYSEKEISELFSQPTEQ